MDYNSLNIIHKQNKIKPVTSESIILEYLILFYSKIITLLEPGVERFLAAQGKILLKLLMYHSAKFNPNIKL